MDLKAIVEANRVYAANEATSLDAYVTEMAALHAKGWANFTDDDFIRLSLIMNYAAQAVNMLRAKIDELKRSERQLAES